MQRHTFIVTTCALMLAVGCGTPGKYIETGGPESIVSPGDVDIQDVKTAASGMLQSLVSLGVLQKAQNHPARVLMGAIVNDTSSKFSIDELTYRMREELVNSGQAQIVTTYGANAEDKTAQERMKTEAFQSGKSPSQVDSNPDFSLTGRITQIKRTAGDTKQATYTFRLTLTDVRSGLEVWTKTVDTTKQGTKPGIGF